MVATHTSGSSFLHPENILAKAGLVAGKTVADFGCGGGYFVLAASRIVGGDGTVYGVDILKDALSSLESKAKMFGLSNITPVWSDAEQVGAAKAIANHSIDMVLLVQLLSQTTKHDAVLDEVTRVLKPHGTLVVVDWREHNLKIGPAAEQRVSPDEVRQLVERHQYSFRRDIEAGPYHFGMVFERA